MWSNVLLFSAIFDFRATLSHKRGSARKKTTNLAGIINQMKKYEKLSKDNRSTPNAPTASTPNTPATEVKY